MRKAALIILGVLVFYPSLAFAQVNFSGDWELVDPAVVNKTNLAVFSTIPLERGAHITQTAERITITPVNPLNANEGPYVFAMYGKVTLRPRVQDPRVGDSILGTDAFYVRWMGPLLFITTTKLDDPAKYPGREFRDRDGEEPRTADSDLTREFTTMSINADGQLEVLAVRVPGLAVGTISATRYVYTRKRVE